MTDPDHIFGPDDNTRVSRLHNAASDMASTLLECLEYFDDRMDTVDGDDGQPLPNDEMWLAVEIKQVLRRAGVAT
jgi:hypothetical protein